MPFPMPPGSFWAIIAKTEAEQSKPFPSDQYDSVAVAASNLAGSETVQLRVLVDDDINGPQLKQVTDIYGTAINLTAAISAVALEGGPQYVAIKDETASPCSVVWYPKQK